MITERIAALTHYLALERQARLMAQDMLWRCPFCHRPLPDENALCCGEVGQAVKVGP
jgi:hypothetical protein